jgi:GTP cyclohydrolase I
MNNIERGEAAVRELLLAIGEDPEREGLKDTPRRVVKALREMTSGEEDNVAALLKVSFDGGSYDEVVSLAGIPFTSTCEHHLLPFTGFAGVAYLPGKVGSNYRVVGLSKLARVVDVFARRLQLQEQMTTQIADALQKHLDPRGVAVLLEAEHTCMSCRGIKKSGAVMRTSVMRGIFQHNHAARAEVLQMLRRP